ncbi:hypothetical protein V6N12_009260 [Hibiscus sabdariffa]|uniref:Uncharacterized protein n=1 Tax=Hibiscus sabdariffa TaxID=183260 RepID=A0ABR2BJ26_9ROSI
MAASPQQMVHSGFNISVPTQGAPMSHIGPAHHVSHVYASSSLSQSGASRQPVDASLADDSGVQPADDQPVDANLADDSGVQPADDVQNTGVGVSQPSTTHPGDNTHGELFIEDEQGCDEIMANMPQGGDEMVP